MRPTRPPRRAGGLPDLRVEGRDAAGSAAGAGAGVPGLGCEGSGSLAAVLAGESPSCSDSIHSISRFALAYKRVI